MRFNSPEKSLLYLDVIIMNYVFLLLMIPSIWTLILSLWPLQFEALRRGDNINPYQQSNVVMLGMIVIMAAGCYQSVARQAGSRQKWIRVASTCSLISTSRFLATLSDLNDAAADTIMVVTYNAEKSTGLKKSYRVVFQSSR